MRGGMRVLDCTFLFGGDFHFGSSWIWDVPFEASCALNCPPGCWTVLAMYTTFLGQDTPCAASWLRHFAWPRLTVVLAAYCICFFWCVGHRSRGWRSDDNHKLWKMRVILAMSNMSIVPEEKSFPKTLTRICQETALHILEESAQKFWEFSCQSAQKLDILRIFLQKFQNLLNIEEFEWFQVQIGSKWTKLIALVRLDQN